MSNKSGVSDQIISLPGGGGAQSGMGEKFSPDLFTGTGNFTIPIALPSGRNGFQPEINLVYSTGHGNGPFGLGWDLSIPGVSRKTVQGVPVYDESKDVFILSGAEDLVPVSNDDNRTQYRPRTEGLYAVIERILNTKNDYWEVKSKDGLVSIYGTPDCREADPAVIFDPEAPRKVSSWKLTETRDPFGNRIVYTYDRDLQQTDNRHWNQLYLSSIKYVDYQDAGGTERFLIKVNFEYEARPDSFSAFRTGFEIRTTRRCTGIIVETTTETDILTSETFDLQYTESRLNNVSLLKQVQATGHDGAATQPLPPVSFEYTEFDIEKRDFFPLQGSELPARSLANPDMELVDLFGNGLPDIIQMNGTIRYWRNLGDGRFDIPRPMKNSPGGLTLEDPGVQMLDITGEGKAALMVNQIGLSGYYPLKFTGEWDRRSFRKYDVAPSFSLQDPEVKLLDLDGDGVTDALRTGIRFECFLQDADKGWDRTLRIERKRIDAFPDITFSDSRVKLADLTGDGLQDIVLVHDGSIAYWPYKGHGNWGKRIHMKNNPRFPYGYDLNRILIGDVDGDGLADIVYVDHGKVLLWINQGGNSWSDPIEINGTPPVSDADAVRLVDLLGSGIRGVLWSADATSLSRNHMYFLDFTGGSKPYLLHEMDNNIGAVTRVAYEPSTKHYLADQKNRATHWQTNLPFPTQVVARVEIIDEFSKGKLTTEYHYNHGHWDGAEREFRGFGRVDQYDTESFANYHATGLHGAGKEFLPVETKFFSPPTLTKHWFHQGPMGEAFGDWFEADYSDEYWPEDPQILERPPAMNTFLSGLQRRVKRDALRTLRGRTLRTELYALDGSEREDRPYTVTENLHGVREDFPPDPGTEPDRKHIFFPHLLAERTTQWERGDDPMNALSFTEDYDEYGQPGKETRIACPRGWKDLHDRGMEPFLATRTETQYANPDDPSVHIRNRVAKITEYEIVNNGTQSLLQLKDTTADSSSLSIIGQQLHFYDGPAFTGRDFGELGTRGALVRTETLVMTEAILQRAYRSRDAVLPTTEIPPFLDPDGPPSWPSEYPQAFRDQMPALAGYTFQEGNEDSPFSRGYYSATVRHSYDFHADPSGNGKGLLCIIRDPLGNDTTIHYDDHDDYHLLPSRVVDAKGLETHATYDYRLLQVNQVTDPNGNRTAYAYTPAGLLKSVAVMGKTGENVGDTRNEPSLKYEYDFLAFINKGLPVSIRTIMREHHIHDADVAEEKENNTIESVEYSDGFGRLLQARAQAEDLIFGDSPFGDVGLDPDQSQPVGDAVARLRNPSDTPRVVVTGWQIYDNKGRVVEKYEPFYSEGRGYAAPTDAQYGQKITSYYDPRGQQIRALNPDGSQERVIFGRPVDKNALSLTKAGLESLDLPAGFIPTPWESYSYDANDLAELTHPEDTSGPASHHFTPASMVLDGLGRLRREVIRNGADSSTDWYITTNTYDIRGNLFTVTDALGRKAFTYCYDLLDRVLSVDSIDAGRRASVFDATGNLIEYRDSKGSLVLHIYDELNRPKELWARDEGASAVTLRERIRYGDEDEPDAAKLRNSLGRPVSHHDEAGLLAMPDYDFKGNLLEKSRQTIQDNALANNWQADWAAEDAEDAIENTLYQTSTRYDALNRPVEVIYPEDVKGDRKKLLPRYNRAGALEAVRLGEDDYVTQIAYNARGQRILIAYGNGIMTRHAYDEKTFRLARLRTENYVFSEDTDQHTRTWSGNGIVRQNFNYRYDLAGNIKEIEEKVKNCGILNNPHGRDQLLRKFSYDPVYRLLSATGRASISNGQPPTSDESLAGVYNGGTAAPTQDNAPELTEHYTQTYTYDPAGNMLKMHYSAPSGQWTRRFGMGGFTPGEWQEKLSTLPAGHVVDWGKEGNRLTSVGDENQAPNHHFDANGNLIRQNSEKHHAWDHADRMIAYRVQPESSSNASIQARYLYGADGMRVKKWVRRSNGSSHDASIVYIDKLFEHHRWQKDDGGQNNVLHVMDDQSRIAMVRVGDRHPDDYGERVQYHLGDHLGSSHLVVGGEDADGQTFINREEYFPYGETSFGSFGRKRYRFTGKERDEESGLNYHGARYYAPWLARWTSCDPLNIAEFNNDSEYNKTGAKTAFSKNNTESNGNGLSRNSTRKKADDPQLLNNYSYVLNNPLRYVDPTGYSSEDPDNSGEWIMVSVERGTQVAADLNEDLILLAYEIYEEWNAAEASVQRMPGREFERLYPGQLQALGIKNRWGYEVIMIRSGVVEQIGKERINQTLGVTISTSSHRGSRILRRVTSSLGTRVALRGFVPLSVDPINDAEKLAEGGGGVGNALIHRIIVEAYRDMQITAEEANHLSNRSDFARNFTHTDVRTYIEARRIQTGGNPCRKCR